MLGFAPHLVFHPGSAAVRIYQADLAATLSLIADIDATKGVVLDVYLVTEKATCLQDQLAVIVSTHLAQ